MRVNNNPLQTIVDALNLNKQQQNTALTELATGRRINAPSDDPVGTASVIQDTFQLSADTQYSSNVAALQGQLQVADSTLSNVVASLTQAVTLGTQGANGTLSSTDRQAIANEVGGVKDQLVGLANLQYEGNYLFAGTNTRTQPYTANSTAPGGVTYTGNDNANSVQISQGQFTPSNLPGSKLFSSASNNVFKAVDDLQKALTSGTGIDTATAEVQSAFNYVNSQRSFYGTTLARLNSTSTFLSSEQLQVQQHQTTISGANLAQVSSDLLQSQTAAQALIGAASRVNQGGLINILH
jgi:flagellar hook-associated protein 3 FlgL